MPQKRPYRKSTSGCKTCKRRRIKCDEFHPQCSQCTKYGVECDFSNARSSRVSSAESHTKLLLPPLSQPMVVHPSFDDTSTSRMTELRLMYHYPNLALRLSALKEDHNRWIAWSEHVPTLAFTSGPSSPLLDLLLANSALHLQLTTNDSSMKLAAVQKFQVGIRKMKDMMLGVNKDNSPIVFASSSLISLHVLFSRQEQYRQQRLSGAVYRVPTDWLRATQGTRSIVDLTQDWIRNSAFRQFLPEHPITFPGWPMDEDSPFAELLLGLDNEPPDCKTVAAYRSAVAYLSWSYASYLKGERAAALRPKILGFSNACSPLLIELLEKNDPRTIVIFAHFFGLTAHLTDTWWRNAVAKYEIPGLLSLVPQDWLWAMVWPLQQIEMEPPNKIKDISSPTTPETPIDGNMIAMRY